jgi:6-phosphogluconolactonase
MNEPLASHSGLIVVADGAALVRSLAERFVDAGRDAIAERARFDVALSGGSTPKDAYAMLAREPLRNSLEWSKVRFFFGDERCVPPSDAQSNYKMARDALFEPLAIAAEQIFRIRGEDEPGTAARAYADALKTELGPNPVFDLILLGMGPDGHTASLFPGSDPCEDDELLVRAPYVAKFSTYRITVTPRLINAGREVVIAAAGSEKAAPLATALEGPYDPKACPIQIVHPADGRLTWLVDRAAGGRLRGRVI